MWEAFLARKGPVLAGVVAGTLSGMLLLVLQGEELGALLAPAATALGGLVGYFWTSSRAPGSAKDGSADENRDDLFAWIFGSLSAALVLHTVVQGFGP